MKSNELIGLKLNFELIRLTVAFGVIAGVIAAYSLNELIFKNSLLGLLWIGGMLSAIFMGFYIIFISIYFFPINWEGFLKNETRLTLELIAHNQYMIGVLFFLNLFHNFFHKLVPQTSLFFD